MTDILDWFGIAWAVKRDKAGTTHLVVEAGPQLKAQLDRIEAQLSKLTPHIVPYNVQMDEQQRQMFLAQRAVMKE